MDCKLGKLDNCILTGFKNFLQNYFGSISSLDHTKIHNQLEAKLTTIGYRKQLQCVCELKYQKYIFFTMCTQLEYGQLLLCFSMSVFTSLLGMRRVVGRGRLVTGLVRRPLLNQSVMAERSYV